MVTFYSHKLRNISSTAKYDKGETNFPFIYNSMHAIQKKITRKGYLIQKTRKHRFDCLGTNHYIFENLYLIYLIARKKLQFSDFFINQTFMSTISYHIKFSILTFFAVANCWWIMKFRFCIVTQNYTTLV